MSFISGFFIFIFYFNSCFFNWSTVDLQCCLSFSCTARWFGYTSISISLSISILSQIVFPHRLLHFRVLQGGWHLDLQKIAIPSDRCVSFSYWTHSSFSAERHGFPIRWGRRIRKAKIHHGPPNTKSFFPWKISLKHMPVCLSKYRKFSLPKPLGSAGWTS